MVMPMTNRKEGAPIKRKQFIKAVLHLPETDNELKSFQCKICDFYATQIEKQLHTYNLTKEQKLEVVRRLMAEHRST